MSQLYTKNKRKFWLKTIIGYLLIALSAPLPILIAISAGAFAASHGCRADEAGSYPCIIGGTDYGDLISIMGVFGWFFMVSFPLAFLGLFLWTAKVKRGAKFLRDGAQYNLADLEDLSVREFEGRTYLEAKVDYQLNKRSIRITFKNEKDEIRFKQGKNGIIEGLLKDDKNYGILILYDSIIRSK